MVLAALAALGYFIYTRFLTSQSERSMARFNQALAIWKRKIERAHKEIVPGWEDWYIPPGPLRQQALSRVHEAALWQIRQNEPHLIPQGYHIIDNGERLAVLEKF